MMIFRILDVLIPALWVLTLLATLVYLWLVRRYEGFFTAARRLFSWRMLVPLLILLLMPLLRLSLVFIEPHELAVVISVLERNGIRPQTLQSGLHFKWPFLEEIERYPKYAQSYTMSGHPQEGARPGDDAIIARTADGQVVILDITAIIRVDAPRLVFLHMYWQHRYVEDLLRPAIRAHTRTEVSKYTVDEVNSERREDVQRAIDAGVKQSCGGVGLIIEQVLVRNIMFSEQYADSVESKMTALQGVTQTRYEAQQIENMARGQGERVRVLAEAEADAVLVRAEAEARARVIHAEAEAAALTAISGPLMGRGDLLTYRYIDKLSPNFKALLLPHDAPLILPRPTMDVRDPVTPDEGDGASDAALPSLPALDSLGAGILPVDHTRVSPPMRALP